jgi:hypothetical protein
MSYTKSPWTISDHLTINAENTEIAKVTDRHRKRDNEENRANARLIASAPDLLEASKELLFKIQTLQGMDETYAAIKALERAIFKAEGK